MLNPLHASPPPPLKQPRPDHQPAEKCHQQPVRHGHDPAFERLVGADAPPARTNRAAGQRRNSNTGPSVWTLGRIQPAVSTALRIPNAPIRRTLPRRPPDRPAASSPRAFPTSTPPTTSPESPAPTDRARGIGNGCGRILMAEKRWGRTPSADRNGPRRMASQGASPGNRGDSFLGFPFQSPLESRRALPRRDSSQCSCAWPRLLPPSRRCSKKSRCQAIPACLEVQDLKVATRFFR